jgi:hypothetical protein
MKHAPPVVPLSGTISYTILFGCMISNHSVYTVHTCWQRLLGMSV